MFPFVPLLMSYPLCECIFIFCLLEKDISQFVVSSPASLVVASHIVRSEKTHTHLSFCFGELFAFQILEISGGKNHSLMQGQCYIRVLLLYIPKQTLLWLLYALPLPHSGLLLSTCCHKTCQKYLENVPLRARWTVCNLYFNCQVLCFYFLLTGEKYSL